MAPEDLRDPQEVRREVRDEEAEFFRREDKMENYQDLIKRQEDLIREQILTLKRRAREQLRAGLVEMAGRGSTALGGFGAGAMTMNRSQLNEPLVLNFKTPIDMVDNMEKQDFEVAKTASNVGKALVQASQNRRTALNAMYTLRDQEIQTIRKQAEMDYNANKDNIKNLLDASVADATMR